MPPNNRKATEEHRRAQQRLCKKRKYLEIKSNPDLLAIEQEKRRNNYRKRKEEGKLKRIYEQTPRAQREQRKKWRENSKRYRQNKKLDERTPTFEPLVIEAAEESIDTTDQTIRCDSLHQFSSESKAVRKADSRVKKKCSSSITPISNEYQVEVEQDEVDYDVCKLETVEHSFTDEDENKGEFVPATKENMPEVNLFAVVHYITDNEKELKHLDFPRLKILTKRNPPLISSPLVLPCPPTYRLRASVTLDHTTSHMCEVVYNTDTDTLTHSECVCESDVCEHTAAFAMWLANQSMASSTRKSKDSSGGDSGGLKLRKSQGNDSGEETKQFTNVGPSSSRVGGRDDAEGEQPPTKRPRVADEVEGQSHEGPADSDTKITVVPLPKDENEPDKSKIKCTFPRKTIYTLWENATGTIIKRYEKIQTTLRTQLQDDDFVIDFTPIEQRVEQLCVLFDKMKGELHKPEYSEFMNITEILVLDRVSKEKSSLRDPLS